MIGSLRGTILEVHAAFALVEVCGIGYVVKSSASVLATLRVGEERLLYTHEHVREDARDLYGFLLREELELFERLLSVSGVGPKVALAALGAGSAAEVRRAILAGDLARLTSVPGVGLKTAQKIILDLKGQLVDEGEMLHGDHEVVEALASLGYPASRVRVALKSVSREIVDVSARVREALKLLAK